MSKNLSIAIVILLVLVVFIAIIVWNMQSSYVTPPTVQPGTTLPVSETVPTDSSVAIDESLKGIDVGDLEKEFGEIDADLKNL